MLSAAEADNKNLRAQLAESERIESELIEAFKVKETEAETFISAIELVSESVKAKQLHNALLSEKQALGILQKQISSLIDNSKKKIASSVEQIEYLLSEAAKCTQEEKHIEAALEFARRELADAEKELKLLKSIPSSSGKDVEAFEKELDSESLPEVRGYKSKVCNALDNHGHESKTRAISDDEDACEQLLSAVEAENEDLRAQLDETERKKSELVEVFKVKESDAVAETFISAIETIVQAYEDLMIQLQDLLQQVVERDNHNMNEFSKKLERPQYNNLRNTRTQSSTVCSDRPNKSMHTKKS